MSRNASGTYSLPAGNPVVTNSVISSTWANTTLADISSALSDSLSRSGLGGMTAGLKLDDGTIGLPGLTFGSETTAGLRRASAGNFRFTIGGVDILFLSATAQAVVGTNSAAAGIRLFQANTNAAADNRYWGSRIDQNGDMHLGIYLDADFPAGVETFKWLQVNRTGSLVDSIAFSANTSISFGGAALSSSGTGSWSGTNTFTKNRTAAGEWALLASSAAPAIGMTETDASANNGKWYQYTVSEQLRFAALADNEMTDGIWVAIDRTGTTVDRVAFPTVSINSFVVGTISGSSPQTSMGYFRSTSTSALHANNSTGTASSTCINVQHENTTGDNSFILFLTEAAGGTQRGSITYNRGGGLTAFNVTSDGRLKKNIRNSSSAIPILNQLKIRAFDWKDSKDNAKLDYWFVAQELYEVMPVAVAKPEDETKGSWGLDTSIIIPLLAKALQEHEMRIAAMETR